MSLVEDGSMILAPNDSLPELDNNNININNNNNNDDSYINDGIWPEYCNPSYRMPNEIEVCVTLASGDYYFPVTIIKSTSLKPYYGGFRNKITGKIYHHGNSQTPTDSRKTIKDTSNLRSRDTQTFETRTLSIQQGREYGTQMERIDLRLDNKHDKVITSKKYFTSEQLLALKIAKCIFIQRCWRGYMARFLAYRIRQRNIDLDKQAKEERERRILEDRAKRETDMNRRLHPKTNPDFSILFNELDSWRRDEIAKIKATTTSGEERTKALTELLADETKALQSIQNLKIAARKDLYAEKTHKMLERMSESHRWQLSNGDVAYVQTPETVRAKELLDLYNALNTSLGIDERLDVLLRVKWTVREYDTQLTRDIAELVDREADLLNRGRPIKSIEKLRIRLGNMFLQFLENGDYNPRARDFVGLPPNH
jgi:hypothetical protein